MERDGTVAAEAVRAESRVGTTARTVLVQAMSPTVEPKQKFGVAKNASAMQRHSTLERTFRRVSTSLKRPSKPLVEARTKPLCSRSCKS